MPEEISEGHIDNWIQNIELFPSAIKDLTNDLSDIQLNWKYRPGGWTIRQVVHHCADSHMNSFIRFKLCLTEDTPAIKPYFESKWAKLPDSTNTPVIDSLDIIRGLHARWIVLLKSLDSSDLKREFIHPEHGMRFSAEKNIGIYAWHSNHHLAHINQAMQHKGNFDD